MNVNRVRKLADTIERIPQFKGVDILGEVRKSNGDGPIYFNMAYLNSEVCGDCGTIHCIAGTACYIWGEKNPSLSEAREILDLTFGVSEALFTPDNLYWFTIKKEQAVWVLRKMADIYEKDVMILGSTIDSLWTESTNEPWKENGS